MTWIVFSLASMLQPTVTLAWNPSTEPNVSYIIYAGRNESSLLPGRWTNGTTYTFWDLPLGERWYFAVSTISVDGLDSPLSAVVSVVVGGSVEPPPMTTPLNLRVIP